MLIFINFSNLYRERLSWSRLLIAHSSPSSAHSIMYASEQIKRFIDRIWFIPWSSFFDNTSNWSVKELGTTSITFHNKFLLNRFYKTTAGCWSKRKKWSKHANMHDEILKFHGELGSQRLCVINCEHFIVGSALRQVLGEQVNARQSIQKQVKYIKFTTPRLWCKFKVTIITR